MKGGRDSLQRCLEKNVVFEQRFEAEKGVSHADNGGSTCRQRVKTSAKARDRSILGFLMTATAS